MNSHEHVPPTNPWDIIVGGCGWCGGVLIWDIADVEWVCVSCGWREFEQTRVGSEASEAVGDQASEKVEVVDATGDEL